MIECLATKADSESMQSLQTKKLDISVYESATWDLKKFRAALEQNLHDMFASFAHQIEAQVSAKVSIDDFNHIFSPEANGQKEAIESAATRISRMKDQLEALHEYVSADRLRQHKVADLNVSVLDLTRKHNASRNAVAQLISTSEAMKESIAALTESEAQLATRVTTLTDDLERHQDASAAARAAQDNRHAQLDTEVQQLQVMSQKMVERLEQIQRFTRETLLTSFDAKLERVSTDLRSALDDVRVAQRQHAQATTALVRKTSDKLELAMTHVTQLDSRLRVLGAHVRTVQDELETVKGPLATLATNLREENVTILKEIERSQVRLPKRSCTDVLVCV